MANYVATSRFYNNAMYQWYVVIEAGGMIKKSGRFAHRSFRLRVDSPTQVKYIYQYFLKLIALSVGESSVCWQIDLRMGKRGMWAQRLQFIINDNCLFLGKLMTYTTMIHCCLFNHSS